MDTDIIVLIIGLVLTVAYVVLVAVTLKHEREFLRDLNRGYRRSKGYYTQAV
jgi:hypothetical protein